MKCSRSEIGSRINTETKTWRNYGNKKMEYKNNNIGKLHQGNRRDGRQNLGNVRYNCKNGYISQRKC